MSPAEFARAVAVGITGRLDGDDVLVDGAEWQVDAPYPDSQLTLTHDDGTEVVVEISVRVIEVIAGSIS